MKTLFIGVIVVAVVACATFRAIDCYDSTQSHKAQERTAKFVRDHACQLKHSLAAHQEWSEGSGELRSIKGHKTYDCGEYGYVLIWSDEVQPYQEQP